MVSTQQLFHHFMGFLEIQGKGEHNYYLKYENHEVKRTEVIMVPLPTSKNFKNIVNQFHFFTEFIKLYRLVDENSIDIVMMMEQEIVEIVRNAVEPHEALHCIVLTCVSLFYRNLEKPTYHYSTPMVMDYSKPVTTEKVRDYKMSRQYQLEALYSIINQVDEKVNLLSRIFPIKDIEKMSMEIQQLKLENENLIKEKENVSSFISSIYEGYVNDLKRREVMLKDAEDRIQNQSELKLDFGNLLQEGLRKYNLKAIKPWLLKIFNRMKHSSSSSSSSLSLSSQSSSSSSSDAPSEKESEGISKEVVTRTVRIVDENQEFPEQSPEKAVQENQGGGSSPMELLIHNDEVLE